jgi:ABC-type lipoprotein release transport system permease subunit
LLHRKVLFFIFDGSLALGVMIGIGGAYIMSNFTGGIRPSGGGGGGAFAQPHITPVFPASDLFTVWLLSFIVSLIDVLYPTWKASRLSPLFNLIQ